MSALDVLIVGLVLTAGLVRGITGFGGAMVMSPPLSLILGPVPAVAIALTLETVVAAIMLPEAWPRISRRILGFLAVPACLMVPVGASLLVTLDPVLMRRLIAGMVVASSLALLAGLRYHGRPRASVSAALGGLAGFLLGATSVGAPPVTLYLLSGPDPMAVTRANMIVFITLTSAIGVAMLVVSGAFTSALMRQALGLAVPFLAAAWIGGRLFARLSDLGVRRMALGLMLVNGMAGLLA